MFQNIYLIDDDDSTLFLHRHFIKSFSFYEHLLEFQDATKAIDSLINDVSGNKNLVLLDLNMPIMSGWEFVDQISSKLTPEQIAKTTIIIVSSSSNPKDLHKADLNPYIFSFVEKPLINSTIQKILCDLEIDL